LRSFHADDKHAQKIPLPFVIAVLENVDDVPTSDGVSVVP
jgi:hypothetical protein